MNMTPKAWYDKMRKRFKDANGYEWVHCYIWGSNQNSEVCETAMRSGIECSALKANSPSEIEMVSNAIMIRERL